MNPLGMVTLDEIWTELAKRYKHIVLCTATDVANDQCQTGFFWQGGMIPAIGLCITCEAKILKKQLESSPKNDKPIND